MITDCSCFLGNLFICVKAQWQDQKEEHHVIWEGLHTVQLDGWGGLQRLRERWHGHWSCVRRHQDQACGPEGGGGCKWKRALWVMLHFSAILMQRNPRFCRYLCCKKQKVAPGELVQHSTSPCVQWGACLIKTPSVSMLTKAQMIVLMFTACWQDRCTVCSMLLLQWLKQLWSAGIRLRLR